MKKTILTFLNTLILSSCLAGELTWFDGKMPVTVYLPTPHETVVDKAFEMFASDIRMVTGLPVAKAMKRNARIVISYGDKQPADAFRLYVKKNQIVIEASNGRGATYGLMELSRMAGVSPWVYWGDVIPPKQKTLTVPDNLDISKTPSVEYRGVFLNDEDFSLREWSKHVADKDAKEHPNINTYREVFKFLLRMRANCIWPAMHSGSKAFFTVKGLKELADSFSIVVGTSHCEPMLRNNVDEWDEKEFGRFNYITNKKKVQKYWKERLLQVNNKKPVVFGKYIYTLGMRGIHDGMMEGVKTLDEQTKGLQKVIDDQRKMLIENVSPEIEKIPQVFVPYKEVLYVLENGLKVPDDVELMWCDDNYGYLTRLPDANQQQRSGGNGIYYHLSYWGRPHDYLWLSTTQPGLIFNEMREAWKHNVKKQWMANVHDIKVAGYDLELFLNLAWDFPAFSQNNLESHLQQWLCRDYGEEAGKRLMPVMKEFYRLCSIRRPEFMGWEQTELDKTKYPQGWSMVTAPEWTEKECDKFLTLYGNLKEEVNDIEPLISDNLKDAFFAGIRYPIFASSAMSEKCIENFRDYNKSLAAYDEIQSLTMQYNNLRNGKWQYIMDCAPRNLNVYFHPEKNGSEISPEVKTPKVDMNSTFKDDDGKNIVVLDASKLKSKEYTAQTVQMLGHSNCALPIDKNKSITFEYEIKDKNSKTTSSRGRGQRAKTQNQQPSLDTVLKYMISIAMIPTQCSDKGDIRFSVSIDGGEEKVFSLKEEFRSEKWKTNVLNNQALNSFQTELGKGKHTITIKALDDHIVFDELRIQNM